MLGDLKMIKGNSLIKSKRKDRHLVKSRIPEVKPDKGKEGGSCNVTACQAPNSARYQHIYNKAFYCFDCAFEINKFAIRVDKIDLFPKLTELMEGRYEPDDI